MNKIFTFTCCTHMQNLQTNFDINKRKFKFSRICRLFVHSVEVRHKSKLKPFVGQDLNA